MCKGEVDMVYLIVVKRKFDDVTYCAFKDIRDANVYRDEMEASDRVDYVEGPFAVIVR